MRIFIKTVALNIKRYSMYTNFKMKNKTDTAYYHYINKYYIGTAVIIDARYLCEKSLIVVEGQLWTVELA